MILARDNVTLDSMAHFWKLCSRLQPRVNLVGGHMGRQRAQQHAVSELGPSVLFFLAGRRRLSRITILELRDTPGWPDRQRWRPWQSVFGGGRDEDLMRLIDSGSGIGHRYDAVTNSGPVNNVLARIATPLSAPPLSGTVGHAGNVDRVRARQQGSTARHTRPWAWRRCGYRKHDKRNMCVKLRLARVRSQVPEACRNKKVPDLRWQTSGIRDRNSLGARDADARGHLLGG